MFLDVILNCLHPPWSKLHLDSQTLSSLPLPSFSISLLLFVHSLSVLSTYHRSASVPLHLHILRATLVLYVDETRTTLSEKSRPFRVFLVFSLAFGYSWKHVVNLTQQQGPWHKCNLFKHHWWSWAIFSIRSSSTSTEHSKSLLLCLLSRIVWNDISCHTLIVHIRDLG